MLDQTTIFLRSAWQEAGNIDKGHNRNFKRITKAHKACGFARGIRVKHTGQYHRLIGNDTDRTPFHTTETGDDVFCKTILDFKEIGFINRLQNQLFHIIRLVRIFRNKRIKRKINTIRRIKARPMRRAVFIVRRQEINQTSYLQQRFDIIVPRTISNR